MRLKNALGASRYSSGELFRLPSSTEGLENAVEKAVSGKKTTAEN